MFYTIGCIDQKLKNLSDVRCDEALILVKLRGSISGITASQLVRFFRKVYRHLSKQALIKRVHRVLDKLKAEGLVKSEVISNFRFARLTEKGHSSIPDAVDSFSILLRAFLATLCKT